MNGFKQVSKEQFYAALKADGRDIMPSVADSGEYSNWYVIRFRTLWGRTYPGWKCDGDPRYLIRESGVQS